MVSSIRVATPNDAADILGIYSPYILSSIVSFELEVPTLELMANRINSTLLNFPWLVLEEDSKVIGFAYATKFKERLAYNWSAEVSLYIDSNHQHKGHGRALYTRLFQILKDQGFSNLFAGISLPNPASIAMHESIGFTKVAHFKNAGYKLNRWIDVGCWQLQLNNSEPDKSPIPFSQMKISED